MMQVKTIVNSHQDWLEKIIIIISSHSWLKSMMTEKSINQLNQWMNCNKRQRNANTIIFCRLLVIMNIRNVESNYISIKLTNITNLLLMNTWKQKYKPSGKNWVWKLRPNMEVSKFPTACLEVAVKKNKVSTLQPCMPLIFHLWTCCL